MIKLKDLDIGEAFQLVPHSYAYLILDQGEEMTLIGLINGLHDLLSNTIEVERISASYYVRVEDNFRATQPKASIEVQLEYARQLREEVISARLGIRKQQLKKDPPEVFSPDKIDALKRVTDKLGAEMSSAWESCSEAARQSMMNMGEISAQLAKLAKVFPPKTGVKTPEISPGASKIIIDSISEDFGNEFQTTIDEDNFKKQMRLPSSSLRRKHRKHYDKLRKNKMDRKK